MPIPKSPELENERLNDGSIFSPYHHPGRRAGDPGHTVLVCHSAWKVKAPYFANLDCVLNEDGSLYWSQIYTDSHGFEWFVERDDGRWYFTHTDYDGDEDWRCGAAKSLGGAVAEIEEQIHFYEADYRTWEEEFV